MREALVGLKEKIAAARQDPLLLRNTAIIVALTAMMIVGFAQLHIPGGGDDWQAFSDAARRMLHLDPGPVYNPTLKPGHYLFFNPPWVLIVLLPFLLLPHQLGWAIGCTATMFLSVLLLRRWLPAPGLLKIGLLLLSPPTLYILLHGQMDVIVLAGVFLPVELWWLVALAKPQNAIGIAFGVPISKWLRAGLITAGVIILTFVLLGNWAKDLLSQPTGFMAAVNYNFWQGLWPYQIPVGVGMLALGIGRKDDRYLVASSPFLSPYITTSSLYGVWLVVLTALNDWQAGLVFAAWWGAILYRMMSGILY